MKNESYIKFSFARDEYLALPASLASQVLAEAVVLKDEYVNNNYVLHVSERPLEVTVISTEKMAGAYAAARLKP